MAARGTKRKSDDESDMKSKVQKPNAFWQQGLLSSMNDPDLQVFTDEKITVIKDKYPKVNRIFQKVY